MLVRLIVVLICCLVVQTTAYSQHSSLHREIENIILHDTDISYELTPGFIIGIIDGDSTYVETFGSKVEERRSKLVEQDVFELGSITKVFTAALVDIAVYEEKIQWNESVNSYLPYKYRNPRLENLTIDQLINHQSGLPKRPYGFGEKEVDPQNPYQFYSKIDLLKSYSLFVDEGKSDVYSHMNYALLEVILEEVYQSNFEQILKSKLLDVVEMNESFIHFKEDRSMLTLGQDRSGNAVRSWDFNSFAGSEGLKSNMKDILKFMQAHLGQSNTFLDLILSDNFNQNNSSFNNKIKVSTGWQIIEVGRRSKAIIHTGSTSGHSTFVGFVPETKTAVVAMSNSNFGTRDLGLLILRMVNKNWKRKSN